MAMDKPVGQELVLGQRLQQARQKAGLTQQSLCQKANLSYSTLAKIERGAIKAPSIFTIQSIAAALEVSLDELVGRLPGTLPPVKEDAPQARLSKAGIKFVYFDVNGCLVRFFQQAFTRIAEDTGVSADVVETAFWHYNDDVCRGQMSLDSFNKMLANRIGVREIDWAKYYLEVVQPMPGMFDLLNWASRYYQVGLLTNIMPGLLDMMKASGLLPDLQFATVVNSSEIGMVKPELAIYDYAAAQAGVSDNAILLVDDSRANLVAAEKRGWRVLWFDDYEPDKSIARVRQVLELVD